MTEDDDLLVRIEASTGHGHVAEAARRGVVPIVAVLVQIRLRQRHEDQTTVDDVAGQGVVLEHGN